MTASCPAMLQEPYCIWSPPAASHLTPLTSLSIICTSLSCCTGACPVQTCAWSAYLPVIGSWFDWSMTDSNQCNSRVTAIWHASCVCTVVHLWGCPSIHCLALGTSCLAALQKMSCLPSGPTASAECRHEVTPQPADFLATCHFVFGILVV